jgi:hypothetical protein
VFTVDGCFVVRITLGLRCVHLFDLFCLRVDLRWRMACLPPAAFSLAAAGNIVRD